MIKFIHCADIHLDAPYQLNHHVSEAIMNDIRKSSFESFRRMVTDAIAEKVDFVLIAGDLYAPGNQSLRTMIFLKQQFQRLKDAHIFVYIILGAADHLTYNRMSWPDNVVIFSDRVESYEFITKEGDVVYIHGFSHQHNISCMNQLELFPTNLVDTSIHIGMVYGRLAADARNNEEFTQEMLNQKLYHYWALGSVHDRRLVSQLPHIHYPGTMQSFMPEDSGKKGYLLVQGDHVDLDIGFVATQYIRFEHAEIKLMDTSKNAVYQDLTDFKRSVRKDGKAIYQLTLINDSETLINLSLIEELLPLIQQYEAHETNFVWIDTINLQQRHDNLTLHREFDEAALSDSSIRQQAFDTLRHDSAVSRFLDDVDAIDYHTLLAVGERRLKARMRDEQ